MQRQIPNRIIDLLESQYGARLEKMKMLQSGDNGSVIRLDFKRRLSAELLTICIKVIPESNGSALRDAQLSKLFYNTPQFKCLAARFEGSIYITTPFFNGQPLASFMQELAKQPLLTRLNVVLDIDQAVKALHSKGIIHRDLKSDNLMIEKRANESFKINVIDLGRGVQVHGESGMEMKITEMGDESVAKIQLIDFVPAEVTALDGSKKKLKHQYSLEDLSLRSTKPVNALFMPWVQLARQGQTQTAPENKGFFSHFFNYAHEQGVGFRSDYYALANLMMQIVPEFKEHIQPILKAEPLHRGLGYNELIEKLKVLSYLMDKELNLNLDDLPAIFKKVAEIESELSHGDKQLLVRYIATGEAGQEFAEALLKVQLLIAYKMHQISLDTAAAKQHFAKVFAEMTVAEAMQLKMYFYTGVENREVLRLLPPPELLSAISAHSSSVDISCSDLSLNKNERSLLLRP